MVINAETRISALLKENPKALDAIIELSPKFSKLRNPVLRKIMAARTSIGAASKIGACTVDDFFAKLQPLGFIIDNSVIQKTVEDKQLPILAFMKKENNLSAEELDVRPVIDSGNDPYSVIMSKVKQLPAGGVLKLVNSFEPLPLIKILSKKGFEYYVEHIGADLVNTYFHKIEDTANIEQPEPKRIQDGDWETMLAVYDGKTEVVDVRNMEMPLPMLTILNKLENMPGNSALYVYHKRIPVFLLPELQEKGFEYRIKEFSQSEVHLLIYRTR